MDTSALFYADREVAKRGRPIPLMNAKDDNGEWAIFLVRNGEIMRIKGQPHDGDYLAREADRPDDWTLGLSNFIVKHTSINRVTHWVSAIREDIHNLAASVDKIALFHEAHLRDKRPTRRFVATELEYIVSVCRSMFDLLQEIALEIWETVELHSPSKPKKRLDPTFTRMVIYKETVSTSEQIADRWHLPAAIAQFYSRYAEFFYGLRRFRDRVLHGGLEIRMVFELDTGYALHPEDEIFFGLYKWSPAELDGLVGRLRPFLAHVIGTTILACEDYAMTMQKTIQFGGDIAPGYQVYSRGLHNRTLSDLLSGK